MKTLQFCSSISVALVALLSSIAVVPQAVAGTGFPTLATNEPTQSAGVFQLVVDPSFAYLFAPISPGGLYYPGYSPTNGVLTSPMLYQGQTWIGSSVPHVRDTTTLGYFPVAVGDPLLAPNPPAASIGSYGQFSLIPPPFDTAPSGVGGVDELFTEIQNLDMTGNVQVYSPSNKECSDSRVPQIPPYLAATVSVRAGPMAIAGLPQNRRCLGIVQQSTPGGPTDPDFAAQSFFDMLVYVTLPQVPNTGAQNFPASGAVLYNDTSNPLIVENLSLSNLPPTVTYTHSAQSTAVPVKFLNSNPPYYNAGEILGYLTLAGHGVFSNATQSGTAPPPTPCERMTAAGGLLDLTLGLVGQPLPGAAVPWLRTTNAFPTPGTTYGSVVNRPVDIFTGATNFLDDVVSFEDPLIGDIIAIRNLSLGALGSSISPPAPLASDTYFNPLGTTFTLEVSVQDGFSDPGFYPAAGGSPSSITITISNTAAGSPPAFDTELTGMEWFGNIVGGSYSGSSIGIRESPTLASLGKHTITTDPRGYRVSSFIDASLEITMNGGGYWIPANKTIRLQPSLPPPMPQSLYVTKVFKQGASTRMVLDWQNSFNLQSSTNVLGPWIDLASVVKGPYTNTVAGTQRYYRLRQ